ncbi:MAG: hypothetical protein LBL47_00090 [Lactobacillus sp.]|nr:hypothetical protein [Lactobacillus sp.]
MTEAKTPEQHLNNLRKSVGDTDKMISWLGDVKDFGNAPSFGGHSYREDVATILQEAGYTAPTIDENAKTDFPSAKDRVDFLVSKIAYLYQRSAGINDGLLSEELDAIKKMRDVENGLVMTPDKLLKNLHNSLGDTDEMISWFGDYEKVADRRDFKTPRKEIAEAFKKGGYSADVASFKDKNLETSGEMLSYMAAQVRTCYENNEPVNMGAVSRGLESIKEQRDKESNPLSRVREKLASKVGLKKVKMPKLFKKMEAKTANILFSSCSKNQSTK